MKPIRVIFNAALNNPNDSREVTLVADAVGVGRTHRLATGQIITWTAELLREKAKTFIGMPVNIDLDEEDEPTGHSRRAVGAITHAFFDERKQVVTVHAALWRHYAPATVARIKELANDPNARNLIQVSMEFIPDGEMIANGDGSETPTDGEFSGLGIVKVGADPRNKVILVAAIAEDEAAKEPMKIDEILSEVRTRFGLSEVKTAEQERDERNTELAAAHEGSLEWYGRRLAEHLAERRGNNYDAPYCYVIATYPKYAIYQEGENYYRVEYTRKGRSLEFGEPSEVDPTYNPVEASASTDEDAPRTSSEVTALEAEITEELRASLREAVLAELKPQLDELESVKAENETLKAEKAAAAEADAKKELIATRMAELDTISPAEGDGKARREALCAALDDDGFAAYKADLAEAVGTKGGLVTDAERHEGTEDNETPLVSADEAAAMVDRAIAAAGYAAPAKDQ